MFLALGVSAQVDIRPAPAWVEQLEIDADATINKQNVRWGLYDLLKDHQVRAGDGTESHYFRTVRKILSPSGVQNASELELDFDPSFERFTLHDVSVIRNGTRIRAYSPSAIRVIEKEDDSDRRIYDGERTALIFVKDVRPGDIIDYSWSLDGANPILNGRFTTELDLSSAVPSARIRHRLVSSRTLHWRGFAPNITPNGLIWERRDVAPFSADDEDRKSVV